MVEDSPWIILRTLSIQEEESSKDMLVVVGGSVGGSG